jgi:hypothetical protein
VTSAPVDLPAGIVYRNCGRELLNLSNRKKTAITNNNQAVLRDIEAKITMLKEIKARNEMLGWTDPETKLDRLRAKQHYFRRNKKPQAELEAIQHEIEKAKAEARAMSDA